MTEQTLIKEIEDFAKAHNLKPSTVCVRATENSRLYERLKRRAQQTEEDARRLREYMARYNAENAVGQDRAPSAVQGAA